MLSCDDEEAQAHPVGHILTMYKPWTIVRTFCSVAWVRLEWSDGIHLAIPMNALLKVGAHDAMAVPEVNCAAVVGCRVCPRVACKWSGM